VRPLAGVGKVEIRVPGDEPCATRRGGTCAIARCGGQDQHKEDGRTSKRMTETSQRGYDREGRASGVSVRPSSSPWDPWGVVSDSLLHPLCEREPEKVDRAEQDQVTRNAHDHVGCHAEESEKPETDERSSETDAQAQSRVACSDPMCKVWVLGVELPYESAKHSLLVVR
jgi:hypothetical protein